MVGEVLTQTCNHILLSLAINQLILQSKQGRCLHSVQDSSLECTVGVEEVFHDILLTLGCNLVVLCTVATSSLGHVGHISGVDYPV